MTPHTHYGDFSKMSRADRLHHVRKVHRKNWASASPLAHAHLHAPEDFKVPRSKQATPPRVKSMYEARSEVLGAALHLASTLVGPEDETTSAHYDASVELGEDMLDNAVIEYYNARKAQIQTEMEALDRG